MDREKAMQMNPFLFGTLKSQLFLLTLMKLNENVINITDKVNK